MRRPLAAITFAALTAGTAMLPAVRGIAQTGSTGATQAPYSGAKNNVKIIPIQRRQRGNKGTDAPSVPDAATPAATGQGSFTPPASRAGTMVSMDFHNTDISGVLKVFATATQMTIVADPSVTGPVTIVAPKQVPLDEAFRILQSVLSVRGFTALQQDNVIQIVPFNTAVANTTHVNTQIDGKALDSKNQVITQVIPLENVDADAMAKQLQPLINKGASIVGATGSNAVIITDTSSNVQRMIDLVAALDKTSIRAEMAVYQLHHAEASGLADMINNLYGRITTRGKTSAPAAGQPGFNPGAQGPQASGGTPSVYAVPETSTNSLIVVASREIQEQITQTIINRIDDDDSNTLSTKLRKIKYADATTVANTINQVLSDQHGAISPSSNSGSPFSTRAFGGGFGGFGGFGGGSSSQQSVQSTDPFAKVAADTRTNSVLITASPEKMVKVEELIDQLDVNIAVESTTFVIPLKNAQAADVASALNQAFSTSTSGSSNTNFNPFFSGTIGGGGNKSGSGAINGHTPIQRRPTTSGRGVGLSSRPPGPPNAPDMGTDGDGVTYGNGGSAIPNGIPGVMTDNGFIPTQNQDASGVTRQGMRFGGGGGGGFGGGFGGGGFGQNNRGGNMTQAMGGTGSNGSFTGLLQLQNNVYAVASPNGDSIIVSTTPNNYEAIKGIVDSLDVVPRQVMIEVIIAEVSLETDQKLGFNLNNVISGLGGTTTGNANVLLPAAGMATGLTPDSAQQGMQAVISSVNHSVLLQALGTDDKVKVLATPRVFTSNNQPALIDIAQQVPYITGQTASGIVSTTVSNTVEFASIGFTLDVTPRITRDGLVTVDVVEDASDLVNYQTLGSGSNAIIAPVFNDRYTDTSVTVKDGDTAVIGGLIRDRTSLNINKVPVLSDIPVLGQFFRSREKTRSKVELMIFVTPHVVSTAEQSRKMAEKAGATVISQIAGISEQQPNLAQPPKPDTKKVKKSAKKPADTNTPATGTTTGAGGDTTTTQDPPKQ
jgi:general secretion pathway protein D